MNPGFGHGHSRKTNTGGEQSKHGIWHEQLEDCPAAADHHGLQVSGLHLHIGSGTDLEHLSQVCGAMETLAKIAGRSITKISAGGGLPVPYRRGGIVRRSGRLFRAMGRDAQTVGSGASIIGCASRSSPAATWWPKAVSWWPKSAA